MINTLTNDVPELMFISWEVMNTCNYSCSYCSPALHRGDRAMPTYDDALEFFKYIDKEIHSGPKMLSLTGGEPTLWPKLNEFLEKLPESYYTEITTNGSRTVRWWNTLVKKATRLDRINISVHLEYADKDHILEVCKILQDYVNVHVMIIFDLTYTDKAVSIAKALKEENLRISLRFKPIVYKKTDTNKKYTSQYTEEQKVLITSYNFNNSRPSKINVPKGFVANGVFKPLNWAQDLISSNQHSFTGMFCQGGLKRLHIDFRGNVFPATCTTGYNNILGRIRDRKIKSIDGIICESLYCSCVPDIRIPKWRLKSD